MRTSVGRVSHTRTSPRGYCMCVLGFLIATRVLGGKQCRVLGAYSGISADDRNLKGCQFQGAPCSRLSDGQFSFHVFVFLLISVPVQSFEVRPTYCTQHPGLRAAVCNTQASVPLFATPRPPCLCLQHPSLRAAVCNTQASVPLFGGAQTADFDFGTGILDQRSQRPASG